MSNRNDHHVAKREDASPREGEHEYGDVTYADPTNKKYPVDTPEHIRAAWGFIHMPSHADKYSKSDVREIERRIERAAEQHGIDLDEHDD